MGIYCLWEQTIHGCLCFISCILIGDTWSEEAIDAFEELTYCARWKVLLAKTVNYEKTSSGLRVPSLEMIDNNTTQVSDVVISVERCK